MPRGKRTKKSGANKGALKTVSPFDPVAGTYSDHLNGVVIKRELVNGERDTTYEDEHNIEREIDELINGNVGQDRKEYLGGDDHHRRNNNFSGRQGSAEGSYHRVNGSKASTESEEGGYGSVEGLEQQSPLSNFVTNIQNEPQVVGVGSGSVQLQEAVGAAYQNQESAEAAEGHQEVLSELADTPSGTLQTIQIAKGRMGTNIKKEMALPGMQQAGPVDSRVRNMPANWQLTPVGRGRVAVSNNVDPKARLSPASERIPTGFNERPLGDPGSGWNNEDNGKRSDTGSDSEDMVPPNLLNGDKNPVSALNEYGQKRGMEVRIEVVSQSGPPHNPSFCMAAFVGGRQFPVVESSNKKDGRREAAEAALKVLASNGNNWTKGNWPTTVQGQASDQEPSHTAEVPPRITTVPVAETKPAKSSANLSWQGKNPVSALYEYGQARGQHVCIEVIEQSGPPHNPRFIMASFMGSHQFPAVEATNKKDGRTEAAVAALRSLSAGGGDLLAAGEAPVGEKQPNGEQQPTGQIALPVEDEVAAQSKNPISVLNEYGQTKGVTVKFDVLSQSGPPHNPRFTIAAYVGDRQFDPVEASNKKEGKRQAAETALKTLVSEGECAEWARYANMLAGEPYENSSGEASFEGPEGPELNQPEDGTATQQNQEQQSVHVSAEEFAALHKNPVSALNEYGQGKGLEVRIDVLSQRGPPHNPRFTIAASLGGRRFQSVVCTNKKDGRREAADVALRTLMAEGQYKVAQGLNQSNSNGGAMDNLGHFDKMAALAHRAFNTLAVTIPDSLSGRKVLAAMIMKTSEEDDGRVISLGTGNRCITGPQMSQEGATVNDSHAEVIARRGFLRFLYQNLLEIEPGVEESLFEGEKSLSDKFKLKEGITFHLYISTAPCGDGALFSPSDASSSGADQNVDGGEHNPTFTTGVQGLLRTKMEAGEGTIPVEQDFAGQTWDGIMHGERLRTMSCSDKICRWNILGMQGALLSQIVETIYLNSLTLGYMYNHGHLTRAVCCRLEKGGKHIVSQLPEKYRVNHPRLGRVTMYDPPRETEKTKPISINWVLKDITPEVTDGSKGQVKGRPGTDTVSQISKSALYKLYKEVSKKYTLEHIVKNTYHASKQGSADYQKAKNIMCQAFRYGGCGEWVKKPMEQDMFF